MSEQALDTLRHSCAHVMAQAVLSIFPEAKLGIGPTIQDGFYYDFELPRPLTPDDLKAIEGVMQQIIAGDHVFQHRTVTPEEARALFADQPYKLELIAGLEQGDADEYGQSTREKLEISIYRQDTFVDLCRGPHLERTGQIDASACKLLSIAGAYWRGDEQRPMLQRIYGTAW